MTYLALILGAIMFYSLGKFSQAPRRIKIKIEGKRNADGSLDALAILDPE